MGDTWKSFDCLFQQIVSTFFLIAVFLYPLKSSENLNVF